MMRCRCVIELTQRVNTRWPLATPHGTDHLDVSTGPASRSRTVTRSADNHGFSHRKGCPDVDSAGPRLTVGDRASPHSNHQELTHSQTVPPGGCAGR